MKINYNGLYRAQRRDAKIHRRRKLNRTEDGRSVKLLNRSNRKWVIKDGTKLLINVQQQVVERVETGQSI